MAEPISTDEFELKLIEFHHGATFALQDPEVQARAIELLGLPEGSAFQFIEAVDLDLGLIHRIAEYLMETEELAADIPAGATDEDSLPLHIALRIGLFIYGWEEDNGRI